MSSGPKHEFEMKDKVRAINVRVITTSGKYPENGQEKVPETEALSGVLARAANALILANSATIDWKLAIVGRDGAVSSTATYEQLGLTGEVKLDWGPNAGGGGQE
jgi:hypothetical protein